MTFNNNPMGNDPNDPLNQHTVHYNTNYNTNYNRGGGKGCLVAIGIVILVFFGFFMLLGMIGAAFGSLADDASTSALRTEPYVEILRVEGTIQEGNYNSYGMAVGYQHGWTLDEIERLSADSLNKGIILYVNSPGGGVYESYELYNALERYKETTGHPVYVYMAQYAASGGLMISMAGDEIYANQMTTTGSIGVIMSYIDMSELMDKLGIKQVNIVSGPNKAMGSEGLNEEQQKIYQDIIDEYYDSFVSIVAKSRNLEKEAVIRMADGRIYTATQAMKLNLIDAIADYSDFTQAMKSRVEFSDCEFVEGNYINNSFLSVFLSKLGIASQPEADTDSELSQLFALVEENETSAITFEAK